MTASSHWSQTEPAVPSAATIIRRRLRQWTLSLDLDVEMVDGIVLAAYEALANVVEHAYQAAGEPGTMTLSATHEHSNLTVTVSDDGTWRPPTPTTNRSHGLELASALSDHFHIDHRPGSGTVVTVAWTLPHPTPTTVGTARS